MKTGFKTLNTLFSAALMAALFLSCQEHTIFHEYHGTSESGWYRGDTVKFVIPAIEEEGTYLEEAGFRTSTRYPFTKFCLVVDQTIYHPAGKKLQVTHRSDTITCHVSDENGKPQGDGLDIFQYVIPFRQEELSAGDSIHVSITHGMQRTSITGIIDVGIRLFKP